MPTEGFLRSVEGFGARSALRGLEFLLIWYVIYRLLLLLRGRRGGLIMGGLLVFGLVYFVSDWLQMNTLRYLMERATVVGGVALVVLFFPELRQMLEQFGSAAPWNQVSLWTVTSVGTDTVNEIMESVRFLSARHTGALIVVERTSQLSEVEASGLQIDSKVSAPLLVSIFQTSSPLHDGAVIVRGDRVVAAACELPMAEVFPHQHLHMRHRAAVGVTETTDVLSIVVSEQTGGISIARGGRLTTGVQPEAIREFLDAHFRQRSRAQRLLRTPLKAVTEKRTKGGPKT